MSSLPTFSLEVKRDDAAGAALMEIAVSGELDGASAPALVETFRELVSDTRGKRLTLNLGAVDFIDSAGLRALIEIEHEADRLEVPLVVVPAPEAVTQLLEVAGVAQRLQVEGDDADGSAKPSFLERTDAEYTPDVLAPSRARSAIRELLENALEQSMLSSVVLMTSELVTNAIRHSAASDSSSIVGLSVVKFRDCIRVEVDDPGPGFDPSTTVLEHAPVPGPDQGGRGLFVVDRSAQRWGVRRLENDRGPRFSVWFEIEPS